MGESGSAMWMCSASDSSSGCRSGSDQGACEMLRKLRSGTELEAGPLVKTEDMVGRRSGGAEKAMDIGFCGCGH